MLCWHYTTGEKLLLIAESGELRPGKAYVPEHEKPILWFSLNQYWDNTVNKGLLKPDGSILQLDMRGTFEGGGGLARIGVSEDTARYGWKALRHISNMDSYMAKHLVKRALEVGTNPREWRGTFDAVPYKKWKAVERFDGNGMWVPMSLIALDVDVLQEQHHAVTAEVG